MKYVKFVKNDQKYKIIWHTTIYMKFIITYSYSHTSWMVIDVPSLGLQCACSWVDVSALIFSYLQAYTVTYTLIIHFSLL